MSARVGVFQEACPGRIEGRHQFEPMAKAAETGVLKVYRTVRLKCLHCDSVVRVKSTWERRNAN